MSVYEALKEYAEAARWNGECAILHRFYGDEGFGVCGDRKCGECRSGFFAGLAEEAGLDHCAAKLVYAHGGIAAIEARMMPEGYEWPRYETGELLRYNDRYIQDGAESEVWHVDFDSYGEATILNRDGSKCTLNNGERVKRPAPKVLDADGAEIKQGDTVWDVESGIEYEVVGIHTDEDTPVRVMRTDGSHLAKAAKPSTLTHERPVLDADGVLCREGDEVWEVRSHRRREIVGTHYRDYETGEPLILCDDDDAIPIPATCVTHTKPEIDTWERIEKDAEKNPFDYCDDVGHRLDTCENSEAYKARDIVRRAKKLAERS